MYLLIHGIMNNFLPKSVPTLISGLASVRSVPLFTVRLGTVFFVRSFVMFFAIAFQKGAEGR